MFIFMYEINGGDLGLSDDQTDQSYIWAKNERKYGAEVPVELTITEPETL